MTESRRIVVLGGMAQMPYPGVAWQVLHYLEGFRRLGHDVVYVEDTGTWRDTQSANDLVDSAREDAREDVVVQSGEVGIKAATMRRLVFLHG